MLNILMKLQTKLESADLPDKLQLTLWDQTSNGQVVLTVPYDDAAAMRVGRFYRLTATEEAAPTA